MFGRDFPTWEEASEVGAFQLFDEDEALALIAHKNGGYFGNV
jgi:hypothetical protein